MIRAAVVGAALAASAVGFALAGCSGGAAPINVTGSVQDCTSTVNTGDQVTVTDSSGKVIGTAALTDDNSAAANAEVKAYAATQGLYNLDDGPTGGLTYMSVYDFKFTGLPGGLPRYGISSGASHGVLWFSAKQMQEGPGLTLGCDN